MLLLASEHTASVLHLLLPSLYFIRGANQQGLSYFPESANKKQWKTVLINYNRLYYVMFLCHPGSGRLCSWCQVKYFLPALVLCRKDRIEIIISLYHSNEITLGFLEWTLALDSSQTEQWTCSRQKQYCKQITCFLQVNFLKWEKMNLCRATMNIIY